MATPTEEVEFLSTKNIETSYCRQYCICLLVSSAFAFTACSAATAVAASAAAADDNVLCYY